jgi:hypothetical protein
MFYLEYLTCPTTHDVHQIIQQTCVKTKNKSLAKYVVSDEFPRIIEAS